MTIVSNPAPVEKAADIEKYGDWRFIIRRQIGSYLVTWQWIRVKHEYISGSMYRYTYRDPKRGNLVFHSEERAVYGRW